MEFRYNSWLKSSVECLACSYFVGGSFLWKVLYQLAGELMSWDFLGEWLVALWCCEYIVEHLGHSRAAFRRDSFMPVFVVVKSPGAS